MKNSKKKINKLLSVFLALTIVFSMFSCVGLTASAATPIATQKVTDAGTAHTWEDMMGTDADGNRYAGRVWVDKSVYKDGDTAILNTSGADGSTFDVELEDDEAFQIIFSALGSSMTTTTKTSSTGPMDVVLILDTSTSMDDIADDTDGNVTRLQLVIEAANDLLDDLITIPNVRIAVVTYNYDSETVLELASYTNGIDLVVTNYFNDGSSDAGVVSAYDNDKQLLGKDSGFTMGTNLQSGIDKGFNILADAQDVEGRIPVAIVLTDGQATVAEKNSWYNINGESRNFVTDERLVLSTLLNAAYNKTKVEAKYGKEQKVYSISVDVDEGDWAHAIMNPGDSENGFNGSNGNSNIRSAYSYFTTWSTAQTVSIGSRDKWSFDHNYPAIEGKTLNDIVANINYVPTENYYDVSSSKLGTTFDQIYEELSSGVFNPITSTTTVDGATGVEDTPLIYVDNIGQYMEIKEIQSVTLFGASYGVVKNSDGTYTVQSGTGSNPTTNEAYNTAEDIIITVTENTDGTQKLEIKINQEILPILLEQVTDETISGESSATINELSYNPLRVYYTVGLASDILLSNGEIDVSKIDSGYKYIDDKTGEITFYSNAFGAMNSNDANGNGLVDNGDAHVGFKPSAANRYYYHQTNQSIFTNVEAANGSEIDWQADEYGVLYEARKYNFTRMSYEDYSNYNGSSDDTEVYTYVTYYRPTADATDAATAAEEVTYIVYTDWKYLKESVAFYDSNAGAYINYDSENDTYVTGGVGYAIPVDKVEEVIAEYKQDNANAEIYAMLGVGSLRTSRLHNMTVAKTVNDTQTADNRYVPEYTYETSTVHNGNDVVVWLGNNGKLTTTIDTGIALTKEVTKAIGNSDDTYELTVTVPAGVSATPVVKDANGNDVTLSIASYSGNVLTVNVKANETVYVTGIPAGTVCEIGENIKGDYYIYSKTDSVTIPALSDVLSGQASQYVTATVTNAPNTYGNLYITKEITSNHTIPDGIMNREFSIQVNVGTALVGKEYTVKDSEQTDTYKVTVDNNGKIALTIKARQTIEILGLPSGTNATVTEVDYGTNFAVSYRTRNHTAEAADNDNQVIIPADANATAVVINNYTPTKTEFNLDISGTKIFTAEAGATLPGGSFTFIVQKYENGGWVDIKETSVSYAENESGTKYFEFNNALDGIEYTEIGTYAYRVIEKKGSVANVSYDRTQFTFDVVVTDNNGQLEAVVIDFENNEIDDGSYEITFNNTYHTAPISVDIVKEITDKSGANEATKAGFGFTAVQTDDNWDALSGGKTFTVYSDASGEARITDACDTAGSYYYVLRENIPAGATLVTTGEYAGKYVLNGWYYDAAEYQVRIDVVDDTFGNLTANITVNGVDQNSDTAEVSFANVYDPDDATVDLNATVKKSLEGKELKDAETFTFKVYNDGTTDAVLTGTNDADGNVTFDDVLKFDRVGTYQYDVVEVKGNTPGMTYDSTIYDLIVEVKNDTTTGKLVAEYYFEDATTKTVTFNNEYNVTPTEYTISGAKELAGRAINKGEFTFELYEGTELIDTAKNKDDGTFVFKTISYDKVGEHTYTIKEVQGEVAGVEYIGVQNPVTVKVTVTDDNSVLKAEADIANADIKFENKYTAKPATVVFDGSKTLVGADLEDNTFTFKIYKTDHNFNTASAALVDTKQNTDGRFTFDTLTFNTTGTYFYAIVEDETVDPISNIVYDGSQHNFRVQVRDNGDGQLKASVLNMDTGVSTGFVANTGASVQFVNAAFDEVTEKQVYISGDNTTEIDGKKVDAGDTLTYFITYVNYNGESVTVDIVDTIPNHTSYVEGSASHNGTYAGHNINWVLNVKSGESVTVSFSVVVDENEAIIENTAVVRDGKNTYKTNEVVNHTVEETSKKDVFLAEDPTTSIDGKKVYSGDELVYTISYTNASSETVDIEIGDIVPDYTTYVDGSADNGGVYKSGKIIWNIDDVAAWSTVTVSFKVAVDDEIGAQTITNEATVKEGNNTYTTNAVTNYTVKEEIDKTVYFVDDVTANIDGREVKTGDVLGYGITYKNTAKETVTVTIIDTVPEHTAYVDGSADNDGVYADGVIIWKLDVAADETVTVTFNVTVKDVEKADISNQATVVVGNNTYTTNEVKTPINNDADDEPTPQPDIEPTPKPTPEPQPESTLQPESPKTSDNINISAWLAVVFISGAMIFAAGRKLRRLSK